MWLNGDLVFKANETSNLKDFLKSCYKEREMRYPKFFKMDNLSKLSILAAELILSEIDIAKFDRNIALIFSNNASSLDTDRKHQDTINDADHYYPSPAVFVYTLPNIGIGEICIRHNLKSENGFFVFDDYNAKFHHNYESFLINSKKTNAVLAGWVNVDEDAFDAFVYLVSVKGKMDHTEQNLIKLYKE